MRLEVGVDVSPPLSRTDRDYRLVVVQDQGVQVRRREHHPRRINAVVAWNSHMAATPYRELSAIRCEELHSKGNIASIFRNEDAVRALVVGLGVVQFWRLSAIMTTRAWYRSLMSARLELVSCVAPVERDVWVARFQHGTRIARRLSDERCSTHEHREQW
jgi:hypothetical protein